MSSARRTVRWLIVAAAIIVAVPVLAYLFAIVVNWRDEPPNTEARELASTPVPPPIEDAENAYVYLLGFAAPLASDPVEEGTRRADRLRKIASGATVPALPADRGSAFDLAHIPPALEALLGPCGTADAGCVSALDAAVAALPEQVQQQRPLIARYLALLRYRQWQEIANTDGSEPPPPYLEVRYARQLFLFDTWLLAAAGDAGEVRARLEADLGFWRRVLVDTDSLLGKAVAAGFSGAQFEWGNLLLRRLPPERRADGVPDGWRKAQTAAERSMRRALTHEWRLLTASLEQFKAKGSSGTAPVTRSRPWTERFNNALSLPLLQPQASANRYAAVFLKLDALFSVPYAELPAALARAPETDTADSGIVARTYNFIGDAIAEPDPAALADYGARVADLEGARRAALVTADLRALTIPAELAGAMVPLAAVRDPYTGGPFGWTPQPAAVTFTGLTRGRTYTFLY